MGPNLRCSSIRGQALYFWALGPRCVVADPDNLFFDDIKILTRREQLVIWRTSLAAWLNRAWLPTEASRLAHYVE